jgi:DNA-binding protein Fis
VTDADAACALLPSRSFRDTVVAAGHRRPETHEALSRIEGGSMSGDRDGGRNGHGSGLAMLARAAADAVPGIVEQLCADKSARVYREALALFERPLLAHALALTGGNQLRAARLLGLNRNTLRKRCRELSLPGTRVVRRPRVTSVAGAD